MPIAWPRCAGWRSLPPGRLEQIEKLEQLRALENGMEIRVALAVERPLADVNTAADLERAERALTRAAMSVDARDAHRRSTSTR